VLRLLNAVNSTFTIYDKICRYYKTTGFHSGTEEDSVPIGSKLLTPSPKEIAHALSAGNLIDQQNIECTTNCLIGSTSQSRQL